MQPTSIGLLEQTLVEEQAGQVAGCTQETLAEELEVMIARSMTTSVALAPAKRGARRAAGQTLRGEG